MNRASHTSPPSPAEHGSNFFHLFARHAERDPAAPAISWGEQTLAYGELAARARKLARQLRATAARPRGFGPETVVAVALPRGPQLIEALLAVQAAGGAYLPLDPAYPPERLAFLLQDSGARWLVTAAGVLSPQVLATLPADVTTLDFAQLTGDRLAEPEGEPPVALPSPEQLAYLIYTSGSTGRPKGVGVPHRGLAALVAAQQRTFGCGPGKRVLQFASPSFDASIFEILLALGTGATLVLAGREALLPGPDLAALLRRQRVSHWVVPPSVLAVLDPHAPEAGGLPDLEVVVCAGEALPAPLVDRWAQGRRMFNAYGPTEGTIWSSVGPCLPFAAAKPTIGTAIPGHHLYVVAPEAQRLDEPKQAGELWIGGVGVSRGYLGRPALTAERFVPDSWSGEGGARLYRTGDAVRRLDDGQLDFVGRLDEQVKIRGFRIEPGEIAHVLEQHEMVRQACVTPHAQGDGEPRLVAYVVSEDASLPPSELTSRLRTFLGGKLPAHLVPASFVVLEAMPLTVHGKVDRTQLPVPAETASADEHDAADEPLDPMTETLLALCRELWGTQVGLHDDLFALGGHSLLVGRLTAAVRQALGLEIGLQAIYAHPTVAALAAHLLGSKESGKVVRRLPPIRRVPRSAPLPLSFPQERVWFLNELAPGNVAYNSQATIAFEGHLVPQHLQRALTAIVARHEVFRSRFPAVDGQPVQIVEPPMAVPLPVVDLAALPAARRSAAAEALVARALRDPFDLQRPPLARWVLVRLDAVPAPRRHVLIQVEHHFVHDGWSFAVLMGEIITHYTAFTEGREPVLPEPPVHSSDFAVWQREWLQGEVLTEYLDFWTRQLAGSPAALDLPTDRPRPRAQSFRGDAIRVEIPAEPAHAFRHLAREAGVTLFTTMLAAFKTLLWRYSGQKDLLVGTAAANRRLKEVESMLGMVVNTLVLRSQLAPRMPFGDLMRRLHATSLGAFAYQDMPLDKLIERLDPERDLSRNPLFQVMFSFHDSPVPDLVLPGVEGEIVERHNGSAKADLNIVAIPRAEQRLGRQRRADREGITLIWEYSTDLFDRATMERMVGHYLQLLESAGRQPRQALADLDLMTREERRQVTLLSHGESLPCPPRALHELFAAAADRHAGQLAIRDAETAWTYGELEERANRLAHWLLGQGVTAEEVVAVCAPRSARLVLAALACLKAGACYLPLDPAHPAERLLYSLEDSGARILLVAGEVLDGELPPGVVRLDLERDWHAVASLPAGRPVAAGGGVDPRRLAYVIYTSGSTGHPKGTEVSHQGAVNLATWHQHAFEVTPGDRATLVASPAFDASVWEVWPYLTAGASLHVPPESARTDPRQLSAWLAQEGVTITFLPTPLAVAMLEEPLPADLALRTLLVGGDRLARPPRPGLPFRLVNNYGPTEDSVVSTSGEVAPAADAAGPVPPPPIGRPLANKRVHVLDGQLRVMPIGVPGELCVAGPGLARGYLRRAALTAERFLPDPFSAEPGGRLYRTGDRVRLLDGGQIAFLGRTDHQVKVRGYRVELGEIEMVLAGHPEVATAVVVPLPEAAGLAAFLIAEKTVAETAAEAAADEWVARLRRYLETRLPDYMVPAGFEVCAELPLAPTGKIDRRALTRRAAAKAWGGDALETAPRTPEEELVAGIWAGLLGREAVGVHENFFALGGHSLLATRVMARLEEAFGVQLSVACLFEAPTVAGLARLVGERLRAGAALPDTVRPVERSATAPELPMSFSQERMWFLDKLIADPAAYHVARAWSLEGPLALAALHGAARTLVARHEVLRTTFSDRGGRPVQQVAPAMTPALPVVDLAGLPAAVRQEEARRLRAREARRPFNLRRLPLWRVHLLRLAGDSHQLLLTQHHIVTDGWSTGIQLRELTAAYQALAAGEEPGKGRAPLQYADVAVWQRQGLSGPALEGLLAWWRQALAGAPAMLELPLDHPRPSFQSFRGAQVGLDLPVPAAAALHRLAAETGTTWFMTLAALFGVLLSRLSGQRRVVVGTPVAGREREEFEGVVGPFVNTLALPLDLGGAPTVGELLRRVRRITLGALAHQALPFEKLVSELAPERDLSHAPVFQALLVPADPQMDRLGLAGLETEILPVDRGESQLDLALFVREGRRGLALGLRYDTSLFEAVTIRRMAGQLASLLTAAPAGTEAPVGSLPLLTPAERHAVLTEWNDTRRPFPDGLRMHELFERQARRDPAALAVVTTDESLTYGQLEAQANRLAHLLRRMSAGPGTLVGVHLDRRPEMVVAVLAVLKAGAAYVPLESTWPAERCRWILENRGVELLITQSWRLEALDAPQPLAGVRHVVCVNRPSAAEAATMFTRPLFTADDIAARLETPPPVQGSSDGSIDAGDLAYIIFTSGSTGTPKGVMVRHRPAVNLIHWVNRTFGVGPGDRLLFTTALSFDLSVYDVFGILAAGATVRLATDAEVGDAPRLVEILTGEPITFWDSAPAALQRLVPLLPPAAVAASLRLVFLSGDWIPVGLPDRIRRTFPAARLISLGGATEATIWSNVHAIERVDPAWTSIPYGRPIQNARYLILDGRLEPCPVGVAGDLFIAGDVVSTGYAGEPRQTAWQYLPDPFGDEPASRLYRTGDRARFWDDGVMEFLGRRDSQVKVRGYRIELGEIEAVLCEDPRVLEVVALCREDRPGDQRLVAYLTTTLDDPSAIFDELRRLAASRLPEYMVPTAFVAMSGWPWTATGKLDRKALPTPEGAAQAARTAQAPQRSAGPVRVNPRQVLEQTITEVWKEVLVREVVGREDNFFDLGGHSLLIASVHTRLEEELARPIPMADLFRYPTIATLAAALVPASEAFTDGPWEGEAAPEEPATAATTPARPAAAGGAVAIIGMAGRFAAAADLETFWQSLREGRELIRFFSDEELLAAGVPEEFVRNPRYVKGRGALADSDRFDAAFFDYSPREAEIIDPQQRLFLECAWEALENAGYIAPAAGERVGVFAGVSPSGYLPELLADPALVSTVGEYALNLANQPDYLPTRVSYKLDLHGPSLSVQTACSTSLVATHLACQALLGGECELALAGGVCVRAQEERGYFFEDGGIASPDGHCRAFDARAAGTVGGSGLGIVVLKRLEQAVADGDTIRAVILGSAINNDGARKVGFTAPSVEGQALVIRQAQKAAGVGPETISYVETHGTATPVGDPIEVAGLKEAFGADCPAGSCAIGSVKTNVGHLDAAAGAAGLIKTALALEHGEIPPSLHFENPNPAADFTRGPFYVAHQRTPWPRSEGAEGPRPRRAGVSSFGIGGTNAHLVLEQAPEGAPSGPSRPVQLLLLSARTAEALERSAARLAEHLERRQEQGTMTPQALADVAHTLRVGRRAFGHRRLVVCQDAAEAVAALRGQAPERTAVRAERPQQPSTVFLFPGQGAQYAGMAAGLYATEAVFREQLDRCAAVLGPLDVDLRSLLRLDHQGPADENLLAEADEALRQTRVAQPALFAVEYALARLWMSWGVRPEAMIGHSVGELVAACLAGVFRLEDGLALIALRGRLMEAMPGGAMLAVAAPEAELERRLAERPGDFDGIDLSAVNGPQACVVAGPPPIVEALRQRLVRDGLECRPLHTSHAFHSRWMEPAAEPFAREVAAVERKAPKIPFLSNVTGTWITDEQALDPSYWAQHLRRPVRFADGLGQLLEQPGRLLLEIGPGRQLSVLARQHPARSQAALIEPTLPHPRQRGQDAPMLARTLGRYWLAGGAVDWTAYCAGESRRRLPLPTYPFAGQAYRAGRRAHARPELAGASRTLEQGAPPAVENRAASGQAPRLSRTEEAIAEVWRQMLGVGSVGPQDDFFELGGSSLLAIRQSALLGEALGVEVPVSLLLEDSCLGPLARRVEALRSGEATAQATSCLVPLRRQGSRPPLFLVHQVGGQAYSFRALARALPADQPVYAFRSPGLEAGEEPLERIEDMASYYLELLRTVQPQGPFLLGGASMGGMVAFEMARQLGQAGKDAEVGLLALFDTPCLDQMPPEEDEASAIAAVFAGHAGVQLDLEKLRSLGSFERRLNHALARASRQSSSLEPETAWRLAQVLHGNARALYAYQPRPLDGRVLLLRAAERRPGDPPRPELAWVRLAEGGLDFVLTPGNHLTMHEAPHVETLAGHLERRLRQTLEALAVENALSR